MIVNPEDEGHIYAYLVWDFLDDLFVLHYAHVKRPYHRMGIITSAINSICPIEKRRHGFVVTHINELTAKMRDRHSFKYNPFIMELIEKFNQRRENA